ncbi:MAG: helix-turn-helix domain-containing protein [Pseudolysinimonas sp.]|uniref:winged helix-turn-helix transcriptional regulator n=1 Tax=Pseudolysinimonas sp. TaxID=2680009 RepID=UPI00326674EC
MSGSTVPRCGDAALKLVADYWVLRIIEELYIADSPLRFAALQRALGDVSPVTLTARLRKLHDREIITRSEGVDGKASVSYELSERGRAILPVIQAISDFAAPSHP